MTQRYQPHAVSVHRCYEVEHPHKCFMLHVCYQGDEVVRARMTVNLWTSFDSGLDDNIEAPDNDMIDIPLHLANDARFQSALLAVGSVGEAVQFLNKYKIEGI